MVCCEKCKKEYKTQITFNKHICKPMTYSEEIIKEISCEYCDKILANKYSKLRHYKTCRKKLIEEEIEEEIEEVEEDNEEKNEKIRKCITILKKDPRKIEELLNDTQTTNITNITNNITNIQNNYVILNITESKLDHICKDLIIDLFKRDDDNFTCNLIKHIHCNPDIPENNNIYVSDFNRKILKFKENDKWNTAIGYDNVCFVLDRIVDISEDKVLDVIHYFRINFPNDNVTKYFNEQWEKLQVNKNKVQFVKNYLKIIFTVLYDQKTNIKNLTN